MSIAFMFLCYTQPHMPEIWQQFLDEKTANIYLHAKNKEQTSTFWKSKLCKKCIKTSWGDISLVKATLILLTYAVYDKSNTHFVLLSDSCLPVNNYNHTYDQISSMKQSNFNIRKSYNPRDTKNAFQKALIKHSQWFILTRDDAEFILNNDHLNDVKKLKLIDERYFGSVLNYYKRPFTDSIKTFDTWKGNYNREMPYYMRDQYPMSLIRVKQGSIVDRVIKGSEVREHVCRKIYDKIYRKLNISTAHPVTFIYLDLLVLSYVKKSGALFMRKINKNTKIDADVIRKILHK